MVDENEREGTWVTYADEKRGKVVHKVDCVATP